MCKLLLSVHCTATINTEVSLYINIFVVSVVWRKQWWGKKNTARTIEAPWNSNVFFRRNGGHYLSYLLALWTMSYVHMSTLTYVLVGRRWWTSLWTSAKQVLHVQVLPILAEVVTVDGGSSRRVPVLFLAAVPYEYRTLGDYGII